MFRAGLGRSCVAPGCVENASHSTRGLAPPLRLHHHSRLPRVRTVPQYGAGRGGVATGGGDRWPPSGGDGGGSAPEHSDHPCMLGPHGGGLLELHNKKRGGYAQRRVVSSAFAFFVRRWIVALTPLCSETIDLITGNLGNVACSVGGFCSGNNRLNQLG